MSEELKTRPLHSTEWNDKPVHKALQNLPSLVQQLKKHESISDADRVEWMYVEMLNQCLYDLVRLQQRLRWLESDIIVLEDGSASIKTKDFKDFQKPVFD